MKVVALLVSVTVISLSVYLYSSQDEDKYQARHKVTVGDIVVSDTVNGFIDSKLSYSVRPLIAGEVENIYVSEGEFVVRDQTLLELDCRHLDGNIAKLDLALKRVEKNISHSIEKKNLLNRMVVSGSKAVSDVSDIEFKISELNFDKEEIKLDMSSISDERESCSVRSAVSGIVTELKIIPGQYIHLGEDVTRIVGDQDIFVYAHVNEFDVKKYKAGQIVTISLGQYAEEIYKGKVSRIDDVVRKGANGNFVKVIFSFDEPPLSRVGAQVIVNVVVKSFPSVKVIPRKFLIARQGRAFVDVLSAGEVQRVEVFPIGSDYLNVGVESGVTDGQVIVGFKGE